MATHQPWKENKNRCEDESRNRSVARAMAESDQSPITPASIVSPPLRVAREKITAGSVSTGMN